MTDCQQPKFKFKKRTASFKKKKKKKEQLLRRKSHDEENDGGDAFESNNNVTALTSSDALRKVKQDEGGEIIAEDTVSSNAVPTSSDIVTSLHKRDESSGLHVSRTGITNDDDDDDDDEDEDEPSALNAILAVERRRKILGANRRGVNAASLLKSNTTGQQQQGHRKLMNQAARDGGNGTGTDDEDGNHEDESKSRNKDLEERLKGTFAGGSLAGSNDLGAGEEGGVLAKKHRKAMEDFIQSNMLHKDEKNKQQQSESNSTEGDDVSGAAGGIKSAAEQEKELFAEVMTDSGVNLAPNGNVAGSAKAPLGDSSAGGEGDVGAGGTMMGGTGIAEVALPIDERIKALKETEKSAIAYEKARRARFGMVEESGLHGDVSGSNSLTYQTLPPPNPADTSLEPLLAKAMIPTSFASGPGKRKRRVPEREAETTTTTTSQFFQPTTKPTNVTVSKHNSYGMEYNGESSALPPFSASSAGFDVQRSDVSTLGASYSHNFQLHTREWVSRRRDERQSEIEAIQAAKEAEDGPAESRARLGFEAARKLAKGEVLTNTTTTTSMASRKVVVDGKGPNGESLRNEWDRKQGDGNQRSSDDRVWKTFMSKQRNKR